MGWVWRESKPFTLPQPLPTWFKAWLSIVLVLGVVLPLISLVLWGFWWGETRVVVALAKRCALAQIAAYFFMLAFQILSESVNKSLSLVRLGDDSLYVPALTHLEVA